jgi:tetratricopeptide (TPR) repeat protein
VASLAAVAVALAAGCASEPTAPPTPAAAPSAPTTAQAPARTATAPPVPELSPAQAKAQAQKLALEAIDQLQNGDEAGARATLASALALDAGNELAKKMQDQVDADAQKELGATFFRYTVQRDESLSKLAQQYLGDRLRFYILAKYNDIANPSRLAAGQVIKIPGKAPAAAAAATPEPVAKPAPVDADAAARADLAALLQKGRLQQRNGDLEGAYGTFGEAVARFPGNRDAVAQRDGAKAALLRTYDREATQAFQRQNLDLAIAKWDRILELDPANQKARLERERALDLQKRMNEKFGKPN